MSNFRTPLRQMKIMRAHQRCYQGGRHIRILLLKRPTPLNGQCPVVKRVIIYSYTNYSFSTTTTTISQRASEERERERKNINNHYEPLRLWNCRYLNFQVIYWCVLFSSRSFPFNGSAYLPACIFYVIIDWMCLSHTHGRTHGLHTRGRSWKIMIVFFGNKIPKSTRLAIGSHSEKFVIFSHIKNNK